MHVPLTSLRAPVDWAFDGTVAVGVGYRSAMLFAPESSSPLSSNIKWRRGLDAVSVGVNHHAATPGGAPSVAVTEAGSSVPPAADALAAPACEYATVGVAAVSGSGAWTRVIVASGDAGVAPTDADGEAAAEACVPARTDVTPWSTAESPVPVMTDHCAISVDPETSGGANVTAVVVRPVVSAVSAGGPYVADAVYDPSSWPAASRSAPAPGLSSTVYSVMAVAPDASVSVTVDGADAECTAAGSPERIMTLASLFASSCVFVLSSAVIVYVRPPIATSLLCRRSPKRTTSVSAAVKPTLNDGAARSITGGLAAPSACVNANAVGVALLASTSNVNGPSMPGAAASASTVYVALHGPAPPSRDISTAAEAGLPTKRTVGAEPASSMPSRPIERSMRSPARAWPSNGESRAIPVTPSLTTYETDVAVMGWYVIVSGAVDSASGSPSASRMFDEGTTVISSPGAGRASVSVAVRAVASYSTGTTGGSAAPSRAARPTGVVRNDVSPIVAGSMSSLNDRTILSGAGNEIVAVGGVSSVAVSAAFASFGTWNRPETSVRPTTCILYVPSGRRGRSASTGDMPKVSRVSVFPPSGVERAGVPAVAVASVSPSAFLTVMSTELGASAMASLNVTSADRSSTKREAVTTGACESGMRARVPGVMALACVDLSVIGLWALPLAA